MATEATNPNRHQTLVKAVNPFQKEGEAATGLQPGNLCELNSNGNLTTAAATNPAFKVVVDKYDVELEGTYATGDNVFYHVGQPGEEYYCSVEATSSIAEVGDKLEHDSSGDLINTTNGTYVAILKGGTVSSGTTEDKVVEVLN